MMLFLLGSIKRCKRMTLKTLLTITVLSVGVIAVLYLLAIEIDTSSYVWQSTDLASLVRDNHRTDCKLCTSDGNCTEFTSASPPTLDSSSRHVESSRKLSMVVLYDSNRGDWSEDLLSRLLENKRRYCLKHNYDFIVANDIIDRTRPVAWSKLMAVLRQLNTHDTVFYLDMDAIVMNASVSLESLLDNHHIFPSHQYLLMTSDWNGVNTGAFLARNSSWTQAFLRAAWSQVISFS